MIAAMYKLVRSLFLFLAGHVSGKKVARSHDSLELAADRLLDSYEVVDAAHGLAIEFCRSRGSIMTWDFSPYLYVGSGRLEKTNGHILYQLNFPFIFPILPIFVIVVSQIFLGAGLTISILSSIVIHIGFLYIMSSLFIQKIGA